MSQLLGHSITYRVAVGPRAGRKVFTLQTLPACDTDEFTDTAGKVSGFSPHAGVAARADERKKLERLCRYICRPAVAEKRLSLTPGGNVRYQFRARRHRHQHIGNISPEAHEKQIALIGWVSTGAG